MTEKENSGGKMNRRKFIAQTGAVGLTLPMTGLASANESEVKEFTASTSGHVGPGTPGMNKKELADYIDDMREKHGDTAVASIPNPNEKTQQNGGDIGIMASEPIQEPEGEKYVKSWSGEVEVTDSFGTPVVSSNNLIQEYETDVYNENGDRKYMYHHWTSATTYDYVDWTGNLWNAYNHIDFTNGSDLLKYTPAEDKDDNGHTYQLELGVAGVTASGAGAASATLKTEFTLGTDKVRWHPNKTGFSSDEFAVQWIGDKNGGQEAFTGACAEERTDGQTRGFDYEFYLKGGKYAKA